MILYENGKRYWEVVRRFHTFRNNPTMLPVALRDMKRLQQETQSEAVRKRINNFIARHQTKPPGNAPNGGGPQLA